MVARWTTVADLTMLDSLRWRLALVDRRQWARAAVGTLAMLALAGLAWWWMFVRFRPPPSIFDTPVDDTLGYLAMKDFSKLQIGRAHV